MSDVSDFIGSGNWITQLNDNGPSDEKLATPVRGIENPVKNFIKIMRNTVFRVA